MKTTQLLVLSVKMIVGFLVLGGTHARAAETLWLDTLDVRLVSQDWAKAQPNKSVDGAPLRLGGRTFEHGIGTHVNSEWIIELCGDAERLLATVGIDDETKGRFKGAQFSVLGDDKLLWKSSEMKGAAAPEKVDVSLKGVRHLTLRVRQTGDYIFGGHVDWADARIEYQGRKPVAIACLPPEEAVVFTPPAPKTPRINGARIFGVRPQHPFLYTIAASGERPMQFAADSLPASLKLDTTTGQITGHLAEKGEYTITLHATNSLGTTGRKLRIVCGDRIALTPPMGWNSWNCFAGSISEEKVKAAAEAMVSSGLIQHGWTYINIDDYWEQKPSAMERDPTLGGPGRDGEGRIVPNPRFPDMKGLCDFVHSKGLKIGIYSSPGPLTCGQCLGSFDHELLDAQSYGEWGIDYLKHDWCSYRPEMETKRTAKVDLSRYTALSGMSEEWRKMAIPYAIMRAALDAVPRDIVYSFCQYGMADVWKWGDSLGGNCWRTTGDIVDTWNSMSGIGFKQSGREKYAGPGHWNDPDMLIVGMVGWGPKLRPTRLTPSEQYTHVSLWCLLNSPLLIGCDMTQLDAFTLGLLTNDEVLEVNQDPLGQQAGRILQNGELEVWAKTMEDGSKAVGLFNRGRQPAPISVTWNDLKLSGKQIVRDIWRQKDLGTFEGRFESTVAPHGVILVRIFPATSGTVMQVPRLIGAPIAIEDPVGLHRASIEVCDEASRKQTTIAKVKIQP